VQRGAILKNSKKKYGEKIWGIDFWEILPIPLMENNVFELTYPPWSKRHIFPP